MRGSLNGTTATGQHSPEGWNTEATRQAFEPYYEHNYEHTILSEGNDPNLLHDLENRIRWTASEVR